MSRLKQNRSQEMDVTDTTVNSLIMQHESWLRRVLLHRLGDADTVDDVFQEVGLALSKCEQMPDSSQAWLYRVAVKQAYLAKRKLGRFRKLVNSAKARIPSHETVNDPLTWLLGRERQQAVRTAFDELSELDRDILMLKYSEGWTYLELSERIGVSVNAIEHRLLKAKSRLRKCLQDQGIEVTK